MREMKTARLFMNGRSQAVRLPAEFRFAGAEVYIYREGDRVVLATRPVDWNDFFDSPLHATADFMADRRQPPVQERELL
jgi:antitoxin VapB